jgi:hypothetical protein
MLNYAKTILNLALLNFIMIVNILSSDCFNLKLCFFLQSKSVQIIRRP